MRRFRRRWSSFWLSTDTHALEHTKLYPGVREPLEELYRRGKTLAVLTNKPVRISTDIMAALGLADKLYRVYGGNSFEQKKPDPIGVTTLMSETGIGPAETMLVGDSHVDMQTARNAGVAACGVTWGFQTERMLAEQAGCGDRRNASVAGACLKRDSTAHRRCGKRPKTAP